MMNTVVVLEAGIGGLSLGFTKAGFQIVAAFEKDKKSVAVYKRNVNSNIYEYGLLDLPLEKIPEADVIVGNLMRIPAFKTVHERNRLKEFCISDMYLDKVCEILREKKPISFCFVMNRKIYKSSVWPKFLDMLSSLSYKIMWKAINAREVSGFPVEEEQIYIIGSRGGEYQIQMPSNEFEPQILPFREFVSDTVEDDWYYKVEKEKIDKGNKKNSFLCWRRDRYVERSYVDWNLIKLPLVKIDGMLRKLTHREMARLKGFPENFEFDLSNKSWLYKALAYTPNVQVVKRVAEGTLVQSQTPMKKIQMVNGQKFEELFGEYLKHQGGEIQEACDNPEIDFVYTYEGFRIYFDLKIYDSNFGVKQNLEKWCDRLSKKEKTNGGKWILVVANIVSSEMKELCKEKFEIFIWDIRNLLWLFEEVPMLKNEFIALLNYSVESIEPEKPVPPVFNNKEEKSEDFGLKEKLQRIKPGQEQYLQYESVCVEILKYVLGDYLTLWNVQEKTNNGMYRFDLCCKIKSNLNQDFFNTIQQYFNTKYIVFEFKNYREQITQKEIYTTEKYLYEKALRRVAVIISRRGPDENARAAARGSLRESGKLILCLSDKDLMDLIDIKEKNEQSTGNFFEAILDDLLIHLEK